MGAALTYARRYALFTLVGIAGEDDLDAPDLCDGPLSPSAVDRSFKPTNDASRLPPRTPGNGYTHVSRKGAIPVTLGPEQSAALREKLLTGLGNLTSADLSAAWAGEALRAKNSLTAADAKLDMLPYFRLKRLPRMADFAIWATACESAFQPAGTFEAAYSSNRRAGIENIVDTDPVASLVREIMADRAQWRGTASDLLQIGANRSGWPKSPRALAGRLRRAQTFLRTLGIDIAFGREGRLGMRTIRITDENQFPNIVRTVSRASDNGDGAGSIHPRPVPQEGPYTNPQIE
jgi:ERF superfamily